MIYYLHIDYYEYKLRVVSELNEIEQVAGKNYQM